MIHILPAPLPLATVLAWREHERAHLLTYGEALAAEQAAQRAVEVWQGLYAKCRPRMEAMHGADSAALHSVLKDAEAAAIDAHQAAADELRRMTSPFSILNETMSRACCR